MARRSLGRYTLALLLISFCGQVFGAPDQTMSITPTATSGTTITAADENARNNEVSTKFNAHSHVDISAFTSVNTFTIGDNAVGNKTYAVDTDQANNPGIRYNTSTDIWTLSNDGSTYLAVAHDAAGSGLTSGAMLFGAGNGAIDRTGVPTNGQILIGSTNNNPVLGTLTAGNGIAITNAAGSITVAGSFAAPALTLSTTNAAGSAATIIRSDATIAAFDATTPAAVAATGATGSAGTAARRDHAHAIGANGWTFVETLSTASGTSVTSATLPTTTNMFMVIIEGVGADTGTLNFSCTGTNSNMAFTFVEGTTWTNTTGGATAALGPISNGSLSGVMYIPRTPSGATNNVIGMPCSIMGNTTTTITTMRTTIGVSVGDGTNAGPAAITTLTFATTGTFDAGAIHIYRRSS